MPAWVGNENEIYIYLKTRSIAIKILLAPMQGYIRLAIVPATDVLSHQEKIVRRPWIRALTTMIKRHHYIGADWVNLEFPIREGHLSQRHPAEWLPS